MTEKNKNPASVLDSFLHNLDSLNEIVGPMMFVQSYLLDNEKEKLNEFLKQNAQLKDSTESDETWLIPVQHFSEHKKINKTIKQIKTTSKLIPRNFVVSFVSEYDSFLGSLIKVFYENKPELLNDIEKQLTFTELVKFNSIDDAKSHIIEKDIESILRKSHAEQFKHMENKFSITLKKDLECWPTFIEIMERRNLFVHADGLISRQYLNVCSEHKVNLEDGSALGTQLTVTPEYIALSHKTITEISIKLTHVLWRKLLPDDREKADTSLLSLSYELIVSKRYSLAIDVLEFAIALPKHYSDTYKRMFFINLAQAYKYSEQDKKAQDLLNRLDWSSVSYKFKLAVAVLQEKYEDANLLMRNAAKTEEIVEHEFLEWPLFQKFRETPGFKKEFKKAYKKYPPENTSATVSKNSNKKSPENEISEPESLASVKKTRAPRQPKTVLNE